MFNKKIQKTVIVDGMKCNHCAKKVETALNKIENVKSVKVDLDKQKVLIILLNDIDDNIIRNTIEELDYKVISIN